MTYYVIKTNKDNLWYKTHYPNQYAFNVRALNAIIANGTLGRSSDEYFFKDKFLSLDCTDLGYSAAKLTNGKYKESVGKIIGLVGNKYDVGVHHYPAKLRLEFADGSTTDTSMYEFQIGLVVTNRVAYSDTKYETIIKNDFKQEIQKDVYGIIYNISRKTQNYALITKVTDSAAMGVRISYTTQTGRKSWTDKPNAIFIVDDQELAAQEYAIEVMKV